MPKLWINGPRDIRTGVGAETALAVTNDTAFVTDEGVVAVDRQRWDEAQRYELDSWVLYEEPHLNRAAEHRAKFASYKSLQKQLGNVLEVGAGPFPQLRDIGRETTEIHLLDPLADRFQVSCPECFYRDGVMDGKPVRVLTGAIEDYEAPAPHDTVIMINVLEHVRDAPAALRSAHAALRKGGTMVFADKSWDGLNVADLYDAGHPIRLNRSVVDGFLKLFSPIFKWEGQADSMGFVHAEHYFIGKKK